MPRRLRKLLGVFLFLTVLLVYVTGAINVADLVISHETHPGLAILFYFFAGILWIIPAGAVIYWMQKPD